MESVSTQRWTRPGAGYAYGHLRRRHGERRDSISQIGIGQIGALVAEERELRSQEAHRLTDEERARLTALNNRLDQCWDLLRQRDALRSAGQDPSGASVRPTDVVENYRG